MTDSYAPLAGMADVVAQPGNAAVLDAVDIGILLSR